MKWQSFLFVVSGNTKWDSHLEEDLANLTIWFCNCAPKHLSSWAENLCPCYELHRDVYSSFIHNHLNWKQLTLVAQRLKHRPAMQETWVLSLGQEDPLEKEMATHSSILAWRIPWTEGPGGLQSMGSQRVRHDWATNTKLKPFCQNITNQFLTMCKCNKSHKNKNTFEQQSYKNTVLF